MPELPELIVYAENLRPLIVGKSIVGAEVHRSRALKQITPEEFIGKLAGRVIEDVAQRGKTLGFTLDSRDRIDVHLMILGGMYYAEDAVPVPCVTLDFGDNTKLVFSDKNHGVVPPKNPKLWIGVNQKEELGIDPLDAAFTAEFLAGVCAKRRVPIKTLLSEQDLIGGLGNAYLDEIFWVAKILYDRVSSTLSEEEVRTIHRSILDILDLALTKTREGLNGKIRGEVRDYFRVHLKGGKTCPRCGGKIAQTRFRGRLTNWCPACQI